MFPKLMEGIALVIGMCILMHAFLSDGTSRPSAATEGPAAEEARPASRKGLTKGRAAYLLFGSSLLVYGFAEVMLRSFS